MKKKPIHNPHDRLFRASMQYPEVAREFLDMHLPDFLKKKLDFSTLEACPNSFIDEELSLLQSDVLLKALVAGEETFFYILAEHQKNPDILMPLRLTKYLTKIWDNYCKQHAGKKMLPLPVIIPLVFYTGSGAYNAPRAIWELCGAQAETMRKIWQSPFALIDVNTLPEERLTSRVWAGTMEFIMRNRFRQQLTHEIQKIAANLNQLIHEKEGKLVIELLSYIVSIDDEHRNIQELATIIHELSPDVENEIMSLAEILRDEGRDEGRVEGRVEGELKNSLEIAQRMLDEGTDPAFVAKVTKLPMKDIKALQKKN